MQIEAIYKDEELWYADEMLSNENDLPSVSVTESLTDRFKAILAPYQDTLKGRDRSEPLDYQALRDECLIGKYLGCHQ